MRIQSPATVDVLDQVLEMVLVQEYMSVSLRCDEAVGTTISSWASHIFVDSSPGRIINASAAFSIELYRTLGLHPSGCRSFAPLVTGREVVRLLFTVIEGYRE